MARFLKRRTFLKASAAAPAVLALARAGGPAMAAANGYKKALIVGKPTEKNLAAVKAAGFDGAETNAADVTPDEAEASRKAADATGTRIHSVLRGWMKFNGSADEVAGSIAKVETGLAAAKGYGADAILLVPCRIGGKKMKVPDPWAFDIQFDPATGHLKQVVAGDNAPYADYIAAHDHATDTSREAIKRLIPTAEKTGVVIAVENVWNNLWVKPDVFANFVRSFDSKWVQAYFDIGNHVKYAPPQDFIKALGALIRKVHVKDFKLNPDGHGGKFVDIREGSVDYPAVMTCLDAAGYRGHGWMTIEGSGGLSDDEKSKRLDLIIAGK